MKQPGEGHLEIKGDNYRLKDRDRGRTPAAATTTEE
jgi:hypothetical protein